MGDAASAAARTAAGEGVHWRGWIGTAAGGSWTFAALRGAPDVHDHARSVGRHGPEGRRSRPVAGGARVTWSWAVVDRDPGARVRSACGAAACPVRCPGRRSRGLIADLGVTVRSGCGRQLPGPVSCPRRRPRGRSRTWARRSGPVAGGAGVVRWATRTWAVGCRSGRDGFGPAVGGARVIPSAAQNVDRGADTDLPAAVRAGFRWRLRGPLGDQDAGRRQIWA